MGTFRAIEPEPHGYGRYTSSPGSYIKEEKIKLIKVIMRNQHFSVITCINVKLGAFEGPWGSHKMIQPELPCYTR